MVIDTQVYYERYGPMVLRRCRRLLGAEDLALDAMQDTFVQLLTHKERLDGRAPSSLLYRMATNVCLNRIRSRRRHPEHPGDQLLQQIAGLHDDTESVTAARGILGALFAKEKVSTQTIAVLHLVDGMTHAEVAAEVGLSVSGVRKRLRTLRARLVAMEGAV